MSRAINREHGVREEAAIRVQQASRDLKYRRFEYELVMPNSVASRSP